MKQKLGILSLGCPRNLVDSEVIAARFNARGYSIVSDIGQAKVALVNTCAFIEDAKRESIDAILDLIELKKQGKLKKIIVCGCLPQRYKDLKEQLPEVDVFVGALKQDHEPKRFALTPKHYAYLKICEGCLNNCSYCVIPGIKGKLKSLDELTIIQKVRRLNRDKIAELNIIGQDITGFGVDASGESRLVALLKKIISNSPDIAWIRLLYLSPERISDELLELIAKNNRLCKYIDLPI
ncbi:MAG: 30S ribosomal protein S12 methylthiotransferase RimO, partial [Candidatus Omnitrophota bacterium]|nr:30S ribosomal protein S12 methylthiotransferase RimO [Candidatus Omnitrophota bacterium]